MKKILIIAVALAVCSCASTKRVNYVQDLMTDTPENIAAEQHIRIKPLDKITIVVNSKDPELASPFNVASTNASLHASANGSVSSGSQLQVRTVDENGYLTMPIIGEIKCSGKTRFELAREIEQKIISGGYISDPMVNVQLSDIRFSVLGEVKGPGQYDIDNDRVTILDALAMAGDMTLYGVRDDVTVIREVDGKRVAGTLDLTSKDIFTSPYFYIQQNDVIYVKPNKYKAQSAEINPNRGFWMSLVSMAMSVTSFIIAMTHLGK